MSEKNINHNVLKAQCDIFKANNHNQDAGTRERLAFFLKRLFKQSSDYQYS